MEKLKNKHDHALTQWLKVIIFAILMMAPFFSVLSRCLYVTCNKNAKDSYSGELINIQPVRNDNLLTEGMTYYVKYDTSMNTNSYNYIFWYSDISIDLYTIFPNLTPRNYCGFQSSRSNILYLYYDITDRTKYETLNNGWGSNLTEFSFVYLNSINSGYSLTGGNMKISYRYSTTYTLDNAFEYSVNQLTQSQTFNWVTNTAIYQPVNAMTTGLGFDANNNIVALLLTYWAILTAVYVLFDIIISCFVKLTHLISGNS